MDDEGRKLNSRVITIPVCLAAAADDIPSGLMAHVCASSPPSVRSQTVGGKSCCGRPGAKPPGIASGGRTDGPDRLTSVIWLPVISDRDNDDRDEERKACTIETADERRQSRWPADYSG